MRHPVTNTLTAITFAAIVTMLPAVPAQAQTGQQLYEQGRAAMDRGALPEAIALFSKALDASPSIAVALRDRGDARRRAKDLDGAMADLDAYLGRVATDPRAFNLRSSARLDANDAPGALSDANMAISIDPTGIIGLVNRGRAHSRLGSKDDALADYSLAIAVSPATAMAWNNRGFVRRDLGDAAGALADFQKALSLDPQLANARRGIESVKGMAETSAPPPMPGDAGSLALPPPPPLDPPGAAAQGADAAWSVEQREALVLAIVRGEQTVGQAAEKNGLGLAPVKQWYDAFLDGGRAALRAQIR